MNKKSWIFTTEQGEKIDLTFRFSAEYLREAHARFGTEFPMDADEKRAWLAGARA